MVPGQPDAMLAVLTVSLLSHSLLDSITTGGKGVGWLWPWSDERFFAPWQVIKVAPFALSRYTTPYGHQVIISELLWVWLPGVVLMGMLWWKSKKPGGGCALPGLLCP